MKIVFQILGMFADQPRLRLFSHLFKSLDQDKNDRGISVLTSQYFKVFCDRGDLSLYLAYARDELFDLLLNCLKEGAPYILELTERI